MNGDGGPNGGLAAKLEAAVGRTPPERIGVLCVGNAARGDDGFGPAVAAELEKMGLQRVFDGGAVPENELPRLAELEPHLVILVDAAHFGGRAGELRLLAPEDMREDDVSTHTASLSALAEFLQLACGARILVLAVQSGPRRTGDGLSAEAQRAATRATRLLATVLRAQPPDEAT